MISSDTFSTKMCRQLYGLAQNRSVPTLEVMDKFVDIHVDADTEGDGLSFFQQRITTMVNIVKKMKQERDGREKDY